MNKIIFLAFLIVMAVACNNSATNKNKLQADDPTTYIKQGDSIVKITFDTLRNTLQKTIADKGFSGAVTFCNVQALPITALHASGEITVSRISDKNRNPKNSLAEMDKIEWAKYMEKLANKDSLYSTVVYKNNEVHYYKPIIMQPMCLSCHGTPEKEIAKELLPIIDALYPSDAAKGYKAGDLRGMWHIVFIKPMADKK